MRSLFTRSITIIATVALALTTFVNTAYAGVMTEKSVTLSNATPAAASVTYDFSFKPTATTKIEYVNLKFCTAAGAYGDACTAPSGLSFSNSSSTISNFGSGSTVGTPTWSTPVVSVPITGSGTETISTAHTMSLKNFTNPSAGVFYVRMLTYSDEGTTPIDSGTVASATIAAVTVSGTQLESLSVTVAANHAGTVCGKSVLASGQSATAINFGTFTSTTSITASQTISIGTNATSGYTARMVESALMTSGSDTIADFGGSSDSSQGTAWNEGTSTGFGICGEGTHANTTSFGSSPYYYLAITNGSAKKIASYSGPAAATDTKIAYTIAVPANQDAGTYSNTVTYNVVPQY